jgi:nicotinate-nucleotide adenylyltransferase
LPRPERIGIFGGTFDPPHIGHVAGACAVQDALSLDRLLLVVANDPWQKSPSRKITPAEDRFAMAQALSEEIPGAEASRIEIDRGGPSFTVMTAETLLNQASEAGRPPPEISLVVGADLVPDLETWERADDLKRLVTLVVVSRPPVSPAGNGDPGRASSPHVAPPGWKVTWVDGPSVDVSSSAVRARLEAGDRVDDVVPAEVVHCIRRRNLYAVGR